MTVQMPLMTLLVGVSKPSQHHGSILQAANQIIQVSINDRLRIRLSR